MNSSYNSFIGNFHEVTSTVKKEVHFIGRGQYYIEVKDGQCIAKFEFTFSNRTRVYKLTEGIYFNSSDIRRISKEFNLSLRDNPYSKTLACSIQGLSEDYGYSVYGAEVNTSNGIFLCVFAKKGESAFVENIYFIDGIYKINSSLLPS
ncbi:MAG: hypothetical protein H6566_16485 [Lewinellaceae bacterium]|nr:hypothetical protein [Lewinellaceae bacterium]